MKLLSFLLSVSFIALALTGCTSSKQQAASAKNPAMENAAVPAAATEAPKLSMLWKQDQGKWEGQLSFSSDGSHVYSTFPAALDATTGEKVWEGAEPGAVSKKFRMPTLAATQSGIFAIYSQADGYEATMGRWDENQNKLSVRVDRVWPEPNTTWTVKGYGHVVEVDPASGTAVLGIGPISKYARYALLPDGPNLKTPKVEWHDPDSNYRPEAPSAVMKPGKTGSEVGATFLIAQRGAYQLWQRVLLGTGEGKREPEEVGREYVMWDSAARNAMWVRPFTGMLQKGIQTTDRLSVLPDGRVVSPEDHLIYGAEASEDQPFEFDKLVYSPGPNAGIAADSSGQRYAVDFDGGSDGAYAKYQLDSDEWNAVGDVTKDRQRFLLTRGGQQGQAPEGWSVWQVEQ